MVNRFNYYTQFFASLSIPRIITLIAQHMVVKCTPGNFQRVAERMDIVFAVQFL